jgi:hypothetical protein
MILYNAKSPFLAVNASSGWLNNVSVADLIQVSLLLIGQLGLGPANRFRYDGHKEKR